MAKPDWGALQHQFLAEHAKSGISPKDWCEAKELKYSSAKRYIKVTSYGAKSQKSTAKKSANSQQQKQRKSEGDRRSQKTCESASSQKSHDTKRAPYNARPGNQNALKHGGYGRRMLLSDAITEDAQALTLDDELFWLRVANLKAAENIGRWQAELELAEGDQAKNYHDLISAAEKAMHRNTARIESLEYTKGSIAKLQVDTAYREAATEKVEMEIDVMKDGDSDNAIIVHNTLPIPGR